MKKKTWIILIVVFLILVALISYFLFFMKFRCSDGTCHGACSAHQPYFCNDYLVERADVCGCPENFSAEDNGCISEFYTNPRDVKLDYVIGGEKKSLDFVVYEGVVDYLNDLPMAITYTGDETPSRQDFKIRDVNEKIQREALMPLVVEIQNFESNKKRQAEIAISLVQEIPYGTSNLTEDFFGSVVNHSRYPYEVLYDNEGICGERSELLAFLLKELGYGVVIFYYGDENHEAVGIRCGFFGDYEDTGYCYVETTTSFNVEGFLDAEVIPIADGKKFSLFSLL